MSAPSRPLRATVPWRVLDGFGNSVRAASACVKPRSIEEMAALIARARDEGVPVSFRGSGRSYGDAALNSGGLAIDVTGLNRVLAFDRATGTIELEPGATIETLWRTGVPHGFWPHVVPGTMHPTMGGCIAMNIHGKNCFKAGPFGNYVTELDLLVADGSVKTLSREREPELFRATIAGLGLLGAVTRVKLGLKRIESGRLEVHAIRTPSLEAMFDCFVERIPQSDYLVGWVDCFAGGRGLGRGLVHQANYLSAAEDPEGRALLDNARQDLGPRIMGVVPRSMMWMAMRPFTNDPGMRFVNTVKYHLPETLSGDGAFLQPHVAFAFLLDYAPGWRRAYGEAGFVQYQVFVPDATARRTMAAVLELCRRRGVVSYLGVFKRHKPDEFLLSHGLDGWSMAMDFAMPRDPQRLHAALRELTELVLDAGGRFYAAKDSVLDAAQFARAYGERLERFRAIKRAIDPGALFQSDLARRLGLVG